MPKLVVEPATKVFKAVGIAEFDVTEYSTFGDDYCFRALFAKPGKQLVPFEEPSDDNYYFMVDKTGSKLHISVERQTTGEKVEWDNMPLADIIDELFTLFSGDVEICER